MLFNFLPPPSTLFHIKQGRIHSSRYGYVSKCGNLEEAFFVNSMLWRLLLLLDTHPLCGLSCFCAEVAQVVEQRTENPRVGSSTLPLGTSNDPPNVGIAYLSYFDIERYSRYYTAFSRIPSNGDSNSNAKIKIEYAFRYRAFIYETAEKEVQDTSCRGVWWCPPTLKVPQDWGIQGVD